MLPKESEYQREALCVIDVHARFRFRDQHQGFGNGKGLVRDWRDQVCDQRCIAGDSKL